MKKKKNLTKDPSAADAASEEMVSHLNIMWSLKCPLTSQPILLQKIVDAEEENTRLEEVEKNLKPRLKSLNLFLNDLSHRLPQNAE